MSKFPNSYFLYVPAPKLSTHSEKLSTFFDQISKPKIFFLRWCSSSLCRVFYRPVHHFQTYEGFFRFSPPFSSFVLYFPAYSHFEYFSLCARRARELTRIITLRTVSHQKTQQCGTFEVYSFRGGVGDGYAASTGYLLVEMCKN